MKKIQMVDLYGQYLNIKSEIDEAIRKVIESTAFIRGGEVGQFEKELADYMGTSHAVACGNGTDALQIAMMALEMRPGDEVITTPFTFIATVEVIRLLGMRPILVDVEPDSFNMDPRQLERVITARTRAVVPVHLFGQCAGMKEILDVAGRHGLFVIEDNAQALGADYTFSDGTSKKAGTIGHIGTTSFFPSKNLGAFGDGGALFTGDDGLAERLRSIVNHGMKERYHYERVGVNSRLDTLQAAILRVKLKYLDQYHQARQRVASWYDRTLSGIDELTIPARRPFSTHIFHQYTIQVPPGIRNDLRNWLREAEIPSMVYYPLPLHLQEAYLDLGCGKGDLPVSEQLCERVLSLPVHTEMEDEQLHFITDRVRAFFSR